MFGSIYEPPICKCKSEEECDASYASNNGSDGCATLWLIDDCYRIVEAGRTDRNDILVEC